MNPILPPPVDQPRHEVVDIDKLRKQLRPRFSEHQKKFANKGTYAVVDFFLDYLTSNGYQIVKEQE